MVRRHWCLTRASLGEESIGKGGDASCQAPIFGLGMCPSRVTRTRTEFTPDYSSYTKQPSANQGTYQSLHFLSLKNVVNVGVKIQAVIRRWLALLWIMQRAFTNGRSPCRMLETSANPSGDPLRLLGQAGHYLGERQSTWTLQSGVGCVLWLRTLS